MNNNTNMVVEEQQPQEYLSIILCNLDINYLAILVQFFSLVSIALEDSMNNNTEMVTEDNNLKNEMGDNNFKTEMAVEENNLKMGDNNLKRGESNLGSLLCSVCFAQVTMHNF